MRWPKSKYIVINTFLIFLWSLVDSFWTPLVYEFLQCHTPISLLQRRETYWKSAINCFLCYIMIVDMFMYDHILWRILLSYKCIYFTRLQYRILSTHSLRNTQVWIFLVVVCIHQSNCLGRLREGNNQMIRNWFAKLKNGFCHTDFTLPGNNIIAYKFIIRKMTEFFIRGIV